MMDNTEDTCETCKFYSKNEDCHRFPPDMEMQWPELYRHEWCGEYRADKATLAVRKFIAEEVIKEETK